MSETIPLSAVEASAGFWELADPAKRLKDAVHKALKDGSLELWLMGSRPPTPEECRIGYQFLQAGTDDLPVTDRIRFASQYSTWPYNLPVQFIHLLNPDDWAPLNAVSPELSDPPGTLLSLVPSTLMEGGPAFKTVGRTNRGNRYTGGAGDDNQPMRIRWALLRSGGGMGPNETTWTTSTYRGNTRETGGSADGVSGPVVVDFRDGLPLTVGPRDSNANIRIGGVNRWQPYADIFSIHIPLPITMQE